MEDANSARKGRTVRRRFVVPPRLRSPPERSNFVSLLLCDNKLVIIQAVLVFVEL